MIRTTLFAFAVLALAGCISGCATQGYQGMTSDQIAALAKMKDANVNCVKGSTPLTGSFITVFVNLDKGVIPDGGISVDGDCKVVLTNTRVTTTVTTTTTPVQPAAVPPAR